MIFFFDTTASCFFGWNEFSSKRIWQENRIRINNLVLLFVLYHKLKSIYKSFCLYFFSFFFIFIIASYYKLWYYDKYYNTFYNFWSYISIIHRLYAYIYQCVVNNNINIVKYVGHNIFQKWLWPCMPWIIYIDNTCNPIRLCDA